MLLLRYDERICITRSHAQLLGFKKTSVSQCVVNPNTSTSEQLLLHKHVGIFAAHDNLYSTQTLWSYTATLVQ